jgi:hypothetical protein
VLRDVASGDDETAVVTADRLGQPVTVWLGAEQQEEPGDLVPGLRPGVDVAGDHPLQAGVTAAVDHRRALLDADHAVVLDLADEVVRHRLPEVAAADHDRHGPREPGQVDRGLASRVAAADHDHVVALELASRTDRSAVVHT